MKLRTKFNREIAKASTLVLIIFLSLFIPWQSYKSKSINDKLTALMHTFIAKDNTYLANAIFENRTQSIRLRIKELLNIDGIRAAAVFSSTGDLLVSSHPARNMSPTRLEFGQAEQAGNTSWVHGESLWYLQTIISFDETIGFVLIEYSMKDIQNKERLSVAFYILIFVALILTMLFLTNRLIRRIILIPVDQLILSMSQIEKGHYGEQIGPVSEDEIGELAKRFNAMSLEIRTSYQQIEKNKSLLDGIIDSMPSILINVDSHCRIKQWNTRAEEESGWDAKAAVGKDIAEIFLFMRPFMPEVRMALAEKKSKKFSKVEVSGQPPERYFDLIVYPIITGAVDDAVVIIDDITTLVRMETTMVQTEKMMSVGGLAAGMAHEINNPLAGMIQNAQVIANRITQDLPANIAAAQSLGITMDIIRKYIQLRQIDSLLNAMKDSGSRAATIVKNMLAFSRQSTARTTKCNINELLDATITLSENDYNLKKKYDFKSIRIVREYDDRLPLVSCDESLIQQVFFNIIRNGAEAMADGPLDKGKQTLWFRTRSMGNEVRVEIEDNGPGMTEEVQKRLFDPFFTTKEVGVGTGLGLSVSYFIISENHRGKIWVESSPGAGAKFIIQLPL